jgi:hypothetical protein
MKSMMLVEADELWKPDLEIVQAIRVEDEAKIQSNWNKDTLKFTPGLKKVIYR